MTQMYVIIVNNVDMAIWQQALTALTDWAQKWQLGISIDKCRVLKLGIQLYAPRLFTNNCELNVVLQAHDIRILVSDRSYPTVYTCT